MCKSRRLLVLLLLVSALLSGCMRDGETKVWTTKEEVVKPEIPEKLEIGEDGEPELSVYDVASEKLEDMRLEAYITGVVAGEMENDWPIEALKAQAILARTFVLKFCSTKNSKYDGADISTDVSEAQAYAPDGINDRVREAVEETRGMVMSAGGEYPYAWFFSHAGGKTELPSIALDFSGDDPSYLASVDSPESDKAPEEVQNWTVSFTLDQVRKACSDVGLKVGEIESVEIGEKGESGRAKTLLVNGTAVSAPSFRIQIGANKLKSTLIDSIDVSEDGVTFTGRGFGHGVGMSQWGAYELAEQGKSAEEIVKHYFKDVDIVKLW